MRKPIVLTGPGATPADVAALFGISRARQNAIRKIVGLPPLPASPKKAPQAKNGSGKNVARARKRV